MHVNDREDTKVESINTVSKMLIPFAGNWIVVLRASRIFSYFWWEEREGEKNTSGHSGQLLVPRRNVIIVAGHAHGMQIKTFIQLCVTVL